MEGMYGVGAHGAQKAVEDDKPPYAKSQHEHPSQSLGEDKGIDPDGKIGESHVKPDQIGEGQGGDPEEKAACQVRDDLQTASKYHNSIVRSTDSIIDPF